jgi:predicted RNA binding protein YcfA (HicA-like mRNA interferase family)
MIQRRKLERHLRQHGCAPKREGGKHSVWTGPGGMSTIPRHRELPRGTARSICERLGVPPIA